MSVQVTPEQMAALRATLLNTSGKTELHERFRALFMLKAVGGDEVINIIAEGESAIDRMPGWRLQFAIPLTLHFECLGEASLRSSESGHPPQLPDPPR